MALRSIASCKRALLLIMYSIISCTSPSDTVMPSERGSSLFSLEEGLGLMTKRGLSVLRLTALTPYRMLMFWFVRI